MQPSLPEHLQEQELSSWQDEVAEEIGVLDKEQDSDDWDLVRDWQDEEVVDHCMADKNTLMDDLLLQDDYPQSAIPVTSFVVPGAAVPIIAPIAPAAPAPDAAVNSCEHTWCWGQTFSDWASTKGSSFTGQLVGLAKELAIQCKGTEACCHEASRIAKHQLEANESKALQDAAFTECQLAIQERKMALEEKWDAINGVTIEQMKAALEKQEATLNKQEAALDKQGKLLEWMAEFLFERKK